MEADWAVDCGSDAARIVVPWDGFVDLRRGAAKVAEAAEYQELGEALARLHGKASRVFTSKCDVWALDGSEIDALEFDADEGRIACGLASYIDIIARDAAIFASFDAQERWMRSGVLALRGEPARCGRVDLVLRPAWVDGRDGFGVTLYAAGCGADPEDARPAWGAVLAAGVGAMLAALPDATMA